MRGGVGQRGCESESTRDSECECQFVIGGESNESEKVRKGER